MDRPTCATCLLLRRPPGEIHKTSGGRCGLSTVLTGASVPRNADLRDSCDFCERHQDWALYERAVRIERYKRCPACNGNGETATDDLCETCGGRGAVKREE